MWSWCLLVIIVTPADATKFSDVKIKISTDIEEEQIFSDVKESTNGVETELSWIQEPELSTQRFSKTYQRVRRIAELTVNSTEQSKLADTSAPTVYTNVTSDTNVTTYFTNATESAFQTRNDSIAAVTQTNNFTETPSTNVLSSSTESLNVESNMNRYTDNDYEDINHLAIVLGVVSVIMIAILVAVASTAVMKRRKRQTDDISLSSQYTALLDD